MITEIRSNLDIIVVILVAILLYHIYVKYVKGNPEGIKK